MLGKGKSSRYGRKRSLSFRRRRVTRKRGVTSGVKQYVHRLIARKSETKMVTAQFVRPVGSFLGVTDLSVQPLHPLGNNVQPGGLHLYNGTGFNERIGLSVNVRKLTLKYVIYPLPQNEVNNPSPTPQDVKIWIGFLKGNRTQMPSTAQFNDLFYVNNTIQSPSSDITDMILPENENLFTIKRRIRHKIGNAVLVEAGDNIQQHSYYTNNDYKYSQSRTIDCTAYINKVIKWNESTTACDTGLYMWAEAVPCDGTGGVTNAYPLEISGVITMTYDDA